MVSQDISFGQVFAPGALASGQQLVAIINGTSQAVQVDAKTFNADGSVKMAVLTLRQPAIGAGLSTSGTLALAPAGTTAAAPIHLATALSTYSLFVNLNIQGAGSVSIDAAAAMRAALTNNSATIWLKGAQATQATVDIPVSGSLRLAVTITAYADGSIASQIGFDNDGAFGATGGTLTYSASVVQNGAVAFTQPTLTQPQYEDWNTTVRTGGTAPQVNVQHDVSYLERIGAVPNFDISAGASTSLLQTEATALSTPGFTAPLSSAGITQNMTETGGRPDIGPTTQANAAWLVSQSATAEQYALSQANAAAGIPWNFYNTSAGTWANTQQYPVLWTDPRGGPGSYTTGLTQQVDPTNTGWTTDTAHQPDLSYDAYILTGDETYLDDLNAQASWAITNAWPASVARNEGQGLVVQGAQIRAAAWSLREIDEASYANPTGSAEQTYFTGIANANWSWLVSQIPAWTAAEGQAYGWLPGTYGNGVVIPPWEEDYFASTAVQAAENGNADALTFLKWESNFLVGRFLNAANGFNPRDGVAYNLTVGDASGNLYSTWAEIETATTAAGGSNGTGWGQSQGDYGELGLQTLAGIITVTGSTDAIKAYGWLLAAGAPYTDAATRQSDVQFDIVPRLADGQLLSGSNVILSTDTSATLLRGSNNDQLIYAGSGNDTVVGGTGINLLFAGSGADILYGGPGNDDLFGGTGAATLIGGGGNDLFEPGTGAATIVLNEAQSGQDTISGFRQGTDHLAIVDAFGKALNAAAITHLLATATTDAAGDTVLALTNNLSLTLTQVSLGTLNSTSFTTTAAALTAPSGTTSTLGGVGTSSSSTTSSSTGSGSQSGSTQTSTPPSAPATPGSGTTTTPTVTGASAGKSYTLANGAHLNSTGSDTINVSAGSSVTIIGSGPSTTTYDNGGLVNFTEVSANGQNGTTVSGGIATIVGGAKAAGLTIQTSATGGASVSVGQGQDTIQSNGRDTISAGGGSATVTAAGNAIVHGNSGRLLFQGGSGTSTIIGGTGNSTIQGASGGVSVTGGSGTLSITGGSGSLSVAAGSGNLTLSGGTGNDSVVGGKGQMTLNPGSGNDTIQFGSGNVSLTVGGGANVLQFVVGKGGGSDTVTGFNFGTDRLDISNPTGGATVTNAIATANGGMQFSLADGTKITFAQFS